MLPVSSEFQSKLNDNHRVIKTKINVYDTWMATPSLGIGFRVWDALDTYSGSQYFPSDSGDPAVVSNIMQHWGSGTPFYLPLEDFSVEYYGYLYVDASRNTYISYRFAGQNIRLTFILNSSTRINNVTLNTKTSLDYESVVDTASTGWQSFSIRITGTRGAIDGGFTALYEYSSDSTTSEDDWSERNLMPINAGMANTTSGFLSPHHVDSHFDLRGSYTESEPTNYEFSVPLGAGGYSEDSSKNYVHADDSSIKLREGKLIKIYAGYDLDSAPTANETIGDIDGTIEYIPRFTGFITGFETDQASNTLTVKCRDVLSLAENILSINMPSPISYWAHGYFKNGLATQPDGVEMPVAYDLWGIVDTIQDLLLYSGIPGELLWGKEKHHNTSGVVVDGNDMIPNNDYVLSAARGYGANNVEEYDYRFDVGTTGFDGVMKVVDTYGYKLETRYDGYVRLRSGNNAIQKINQTGVNNPKAEEGTYESYSSSFTQNFTGSGVTVIVVRNTTSGTADNDNVYWGGTASFKFEIKDGGTPIVTKNYNMYYEEERFYSDGYDYNIGHNPCVIPIAQNLAYDTYDLVITAISGTPFLGIDQVWVYNQSFSDSIMTLQTYKYDGNIGTLNKIDYDRGIQNQRNDILVVGQRKGVWVATGETQRNETINNNPMYTNTHSRSIDVEGVYNTNAPNYTGRHQMTYIQEPTIHSEDHARWLSYNILNAYRSIKNNPNFVVIGDPTVEVNDCISLLDKKSEDGTDNFWIKTIDEEVTKKEWLVDCTVGGVEPFPSFEQTEDKNLSYSGGDYALNIYVQDSNGKTRGKGKNSTTTATATSSTTSLALSDASSFPTTGLVNVMALDAKKAHYGIYEYTSKSGNNLIGSFSWSTDDTYTFLVGSYVIDAYNPYEQDDRDVYMAVGFDCMVSGKVSIGVYKEGAGRAIAGLTDGGGLDDGSPKEQSVWAGDSLEWWWGGVDDFGDPDNSKPAGFMGDDETYYFRITYDRDSDDNSQTYNLSNDDKEFYMKKSRPDELKITVDNVGDRNEAEYSPGDNDYWTTVTNGSGTYRNYVFVSSDKKILININGNIVTNNRSYYIEATPIVEIKNAQAEIRPTTIIQHSSQYTGKSVEIGNNGWVSVSPSNVKTVTIEPATSWFALDVDDKFKYYYDNYKDDSDIRHGFVFFYLVEFKVKDMSGRYIGGADSSGSGDITDNEPSDDTYSKNVWTWYTEKHNGRYVKLLVPEGWTDFNPTAIVAEFMWIPAYIDESQSGTSFAVTPTTVNTGYAKINSYYEYERHAQTHNSDCRWGWVRTAS